MRKIVIHTRTSESTGVVVENGEISEYVSERPGRTCLSGSIFMGKVVNIHHGLQAAFVDIGESRHAFIRKAALPWGKLEKGIAVNEGDRIIVQVIKEPNGNKGAQVTADITLPGLYSIYQPYGNRVSASKNLTGAEKVALQNKLESVLNESEGCIIRTAASTVSQETVLQELEILKDFWYKHIHRERDSKPGVIWVDRILPYQLVRKYPLGSIQEILLDDVDVSQELKQMYPALADKIKWKKDPSQEVPLSINDLQTNLTDKVVVMDGGVQLIIDITEAMTVIDVNSHGFKGKALSNSQSFEVNRQAAMEIQKQIKLRNLAGIIIIDFINMNSPSLEKQLVDHMRRQMKQDPIPSNVLGMTHLGLMELTRKRVWPSPVNPLIRTSELVFAEETILYRLERDLLSQSHRTEAILVAVHPQISRLKKQLLSDSFSSKIPQELFVRQDSTIQGYQIELEGSEDMIREAVKQRGYHVDNLF